MRYLSAALVIFIDLFTAMDDGCPEDILATKRADIPLICTILQERMQSIYSTTSTFAGAAYGVVSNLLEAEKVKKAALHARRNSADGNMMEEAEPVGRVFKRIAQSMSESALKAEPPSTNPSSNTTTTQSSPQPGATTTTMQGALLEQPTFAQPAIAKKSGKQARRTSYAAGDTGRANKQTKTSTEHYRRPSVLDSMPDAEAPGRKLSSPGIIPPPMPAVSSSSTPAFAIDSTLATTRQGSYSSATQNSVPWQSSSQYAQEQPKQQGHGYMPDGHYASTSSHMQLPFSHRYNGDVSAPITWDTSPLFHPDPSVLLHSIGFPASHQQTDTVFARPGNEIQQQNSMAVHDPASQPPSSASQYGLNTQANTHNSTWYSDNASHY